MLNEMAEDQLMAVQYDHAGLCNGSGSKGSHDVGETVGGDVLPLPHCPLNETETMPGFSEAEIPSFSS